MELGVQAGLPQLFLTDGVGGDGKLWRDEVLEGFITVRLKVCGRGWSSDLVGPGGVLM